MSDRRLITPFFLDRPSLPHRGLPGDWLNDLTLHDGPQMQRVSAVHEPLAAEVARTIASGDRPVSIHDQRRDHQPSLGHAFGAENHSDIRLAGSRCDANPGAFEKCRIGRRHLPSHEPVAGYVAFRKADQASAFDGCLRDSLLCQGDRFLGCGRELNIGEGDPKNAHIYPNINVGRARSGGFDIMK